MKRSDAFPSEYFSKDDVMSGPRVLTIKDVCFEAIKGDHGEDNKPVMTFREDDAKRLIVNNTNWVACEDRYGQDSDDWRGKSVELYYEPNVWFGKDKTGGVRVRIPSDVIEEQAAKPAPAFSGNMSWTQALALATVNGINEDKLKELLKARGATGYTPAIHSQWVREIIDFESKDESIPF